MEAVETVLSRLMASALKTTYLMEAVETVLSRLMASALKTENNLLSYTSSPTDSRAF